MNMSQEPGAWEKITTVATLGTRRGTSPEPLTWPHEAIAAAATGASVERSILRCAAATYLWSFAGSRVAVAPTEVSEPAPPITGTFASEAASLRLLRMIGGDYRELIPEWFECAQTHGKSLAPHWLPVVLDGVPEKLRNRHPHVLGAFAAWLAKLNDKWLVSIAVAEPSEQRWSEGSLEERCAELLAKRGLDPARAREWLRSTWSSDPPEAREAFLIALRTGLSLEDEAFLEFALDDKRKGVRQAAVDTLSLLRWSAHAQRMQTRLDPLIVLDPKKTGLFGKGAKRTLTIELPAAIDKAAQRDGVESKPPAHRKIGERSFWLVQMVALVHPGHWTSRFDCDASTFISAVMNTDHALDLLSALSDAASRNADADWLAALTDAWIDSQQEQHVIAQAVARLIGAASASSRAAMLESQVHRLAKRSVDALSYLLDSIEVSWTPKVTSVAIEHIAERARSEKQQWSHSRNSLDAWGRRCDVATAAQLLPNAIACAGDASPWRNALEQFNDIVEFRAAMHRELT